MPPVGFEPTISAGERPRTYAIDRAATGTGTHTQIYMRIPVSGTLSLGVQFPMFREIAVPLQRRYLYTNPDSFTSGKTGILTSNPLWLSDISYVEHTQVPTHNHKLLRMCSLYDTSAPTSCAYRRKTCAVSYMKGVRNKSEHRFTCPRHTWFLFTALSAF